MPAEAGIQEGHLNALDSGFRRNDGKSNSVFIQSFSTEALS
jgi:hypothetical protein